MKNVIELILSWKIFTFHVAKIFQECIWEYLLGFYDARACCCITHEFIIMDWNNPTKSYSNLEIWIAQKCFLGKSSWTHSLKSLCITCPPSLSCWKSWKSNKSVNAMIITCVLLGLALGNLKLNAKRIKFYSIDCFTSQGNKEDVFCNFKNKFQIDYW